MVDKNMISTEELISLLLDRFESAIFIGRKGEEFNPKGYWYEYRGDKIEVLGLAEEIKNRINQER
jgi:hypothetical protein